MRKRPASTLQGTGRAFFLHSVDYHYNNLAYSVLTGRSQTAPRAPAESQGQQWKRHRTEVRALTSDSNRGQPARQVQKTHGIEHEEGADERQDNSKRNSASRVYGFVHIRCDGAKSSLPLTKLSQQPALQNARTAIVRCEVLLDQFLIEFVAFKYFEARAERHLAAFDVGADHGSVHGPVKVAQPFRLMAGGTRHRLGNSSCKAWAKTT